jgi:hypothetical protein
MGYVLKVIWACKLFLTGASAWKVCSESFLSPTCCASAFYAAVIFTAVLFSMKQNRVSISVSTLEDLYLRQLEEGLGETIFVPVKQNYGDLYSGIRTDQCEWKDSFKEKYS